MNTTGSDNIGRDSEGESWEQVMNMVQTDVNIRVYPGVQYSEV